MCIIHLSVALFFAQDKTNSKVVKEETTGESAGAAVAAAAATVYSQNKRGRDDF